MRKKWVCAECGGDELIFDATAVWDMASQKFIVSDAHDNRPYCCDCDDEVKGKVVQTNELEE